MKDQKNEVTDGGVLHMLPQPIAQGPNEMLALFGSKSFIVLLERISVVRIDSRGIRIEDYRLVFRRIRLAAG
jgi:hypothetical protein